jgi:hypothetical protein
MTTIDFLHNHFVAITILYILTLAGLLARSMFARRIELRIAPLEMKLECSAQIVEVVEVLGEREGGGGGGLHPPTLNDLEPGESPPSKNSDQITDPRVNVIGVPGKA